MNINATIFGQSIAFAVFVWFCMKYIWPPIQFALRERERKIADGIASSEKATKALVDAEKRALHKLHKAKEDAQFILDQASKRANSIVEASKEQAKIEGEKVIDAAHASIEQERNQVKDSLRKEAGGLAIKAVAKILDPSNEEYASKTLKELANNKLVDRLILEL